jgi:hypothetical protein
LKDPQICTALLYKALEIFEKMYGDDHPIMQKYYSYSSEVASEAEDSEMMI